MENLHRNILKEGKKEKRKSRDLRKRSLKTDRETESREATKGHISERRGDRERRSYIGMSQKRGRG